MGSWGTGPFDNDSAGDWKYELEEGGVEYLRDSLQIIVDAEDDDELEEPECSGAVGAAEVVAAMKGEGLKDLPDEVVTWLKSKPRFSQDLVKLAKDAMTRISRGGELKDLWDEAGPEHANAWKASMKDLLKRLS